MGRFEAITAASFIGGARRLPARSTIEVRDPGRTRDVVGTAGVVDAASVGDVVAAAAAAQPAWAARGVEERADVLLRACTIIEAVADELATTLTRENGALLPVSRNEFDAASRVFRFATEHALSALSRPERHAGAGGSITIERRPYGVVAAIVPWNAPVVLAAQKVAPALAAGNAIVLKPSPYAPLAVTILLEQIANSLPAGVLNVVHGDAEVGAALVSDPHVRMLTFTGGATGAKAIIRNAADSLIRLHFELGGNDPALVLDGADLESTAQAIVDQAFRRCGQVCYAIKRVYVPRRHRATFADIALDHLARYRIGHGLDPRTTMGPVNNSVQVDRVNTFLGQLDAAGVPIERRGDAVDPDAWEDGHFITPVIVPDAPSDAPVVLDEQFGPILPIVAYDDVDEAVEMANATQFGLASSVWSSDVDHAQSVARRIDAGMTFVNGHTLTPVAQQFAPFGGVKHSGIGWENSSVGLAEYLEYHSVHLPEAS